MEKIWDWGLEVIRFFQTIKSPAVTAVIGFISNLGGPAAYIFLLCILLWVYDQKKGFRLGFILLFSASVNNALKFHFNVPRPYTKDPSVGLAVEKSSSTPSAHAQNSAAFWSYFAFLNPKLRKDSALSIAFGIPFIIGLTRIYLGVHYPSDVFLGWGIGFGISVYTIFLSKYAEKILEKMPKMFKILIAAVLVMIFNFFSPEDTSMQAALFGLCTGYILITGDKGFDASSGTVLQKIIRSVLGAAVVAALYYGLKIVLPAEGSTNYQLFKFLRYAVIGFVGTYVLPKLFLLFKLAKPYEV